MKLPIWSGDVLAMGAFAMFLVGAANALTDAALVALLVLTIVGAATAQSLVASLLASRPLTWMGEVSYSLYIVHFPALIVIRRLLESLGYEAWGRIGQALACAGTVGVVIVLAAILFYLAERPARQHLRDHAGVLAPA